MNARQVARVLPELHLLTILAATRSFTLSARYLGISKSSVSMRLKSLEQTLGVQLVRRTTRSLRLTPAGTQLVEQTGASFAQIERGIAGASDLAGAPRGLVRMTTPVAFGRQHVAPVLPGLCRRYPDIRIELELSDRFINLTQEGFDLAVRHAGHVPENHVATVLCKSSSVLMASPDYLRQRGTPQHPGDLARHDCLLYLRDGGAPTWSFQRTGERRLTGQVSVAVSGPLRVNNSEVLRAAVAGGLGIGLLPDFTAFAGGATCELVQVLPDWKPIGFFGERLHVIRPWAARAPRAVACVIEHLRGAFSRGFAPPGQR